MSDIFFNANKMPKPRNEYVAFLDIMGTRSHMKKSISETANFIFKLHSAIISAWREKAYKSVFVYPVMDGAYITSTNKENLINILIRVFRNLTAQFMAESNVDYLYLVRGAIAYGEVVHGHNVPYSASKAFELDLGYKDNILLGNAMILAYDGEGKAAPYGIFIDETAIKGSGVKSGAFQREWKWYSDETLTVDKSIPTQMTAKILSYLDLLKDPNHSLHYPKEKIAYHKELTREYYKLEKK